MNGAKILAETIEKVVDDKIAKAMRGGTQTVEAEYVGTDSQGKSWVLLPGADSATPVKSMAVEAKAGDVVSVTIGNGRATVSSNVSNPGAGVAGVSEVRETATVAKDTADEATVSASQALNAAATAQDSADRALVSADNAAEAAARADTHAEEAMQSAATAGDAASRAIASADTANEAASQAVADASTARTAAESAVEDAADAKQAAQGAQADASAAATSASQAATSASQASTSASNAATSASNAESSASQAASSASSAQSQASAAKTAADEAKADAATAKSQAASAVSDAATAKQQAAAATTAANGAVTGLATVQQVVDSLETDMDDMQTHVAMMDAYSDGHGGTIPAGLHVVPNASGYFLVLANDGTYVYDSQSNLVTKFGESIDFASTRPQKIGNSTAYVRFYDSDNDGVADRIEIVADSIRLGSTDVATAVSNAQSAADAALADSVEYIVGTQAAATNAWTGVTRESSLVAGKKIAYKLPYAGNSSAATLNLTLAGGGTTGAKGVKYNSNNSADNNVTTHFGAGSVVEMTYDGTVWRVAAGYYDTGGINNARYRTQNPNAIKAVAACTSGHIICGTKDGYRDVGAGIAFDLSYPLLWCGATIAATKTGTGNYLTYNGVNVATSGAVTGTAVNSMVWLKGTVTGNTFTIASSGWLTCTIPTTEDGYCYMPLGIAYSTTPAIYFSSPKDVYAYKDGAFGPVSIREASAAAKTATNYVAEVTNGIMVHPVGDDTSGWKIADAIELLKSGASYIKAWLDNSVAKIRVGLENSGHSVFSPSGMEVFTDASTSVASFGAGGARIGNGSQPHVEITPLGMSVTGVGANAKPRFSINANDMYSVDPFSPSGGISMGMVTSLSSGFAKITPAAMSIGDPARANEDGATFVASSDKIRIGKASTANQLLDYHSMQLVDKEGTTFFHVSDLRDEEGFFTCTYRGNGSASFFVLEPSAASNDYTVTVDGVVQTSEIRTKVAGAFYFVTAPEDGAIIKARYMPKSEFGSQLKAYTFGIPNTTANLYDDPRSPINQIGRYSVREGMNTAASGVASHAEGWDSFAFGSAAHAEGRGTVAFGPYSHAEGKDTRTDGDYSHTQNEGTVASSRNQTALGTYNDASDDGSVVTHPSGSIWYGKYAVMLGNGTADNARSNALTIEWDGTVETAGSAIAKDSAITMNDTPTDANVTSQGFYVEDSNDVWLSRVVARNYTSGRQGTLIEAHRTVNGTDKYNTLNIGVEANGNSYVSVSDAAAWRTGIGAVSKAGDTMTGDLVLKDAAIDRDGATPSSDQIGRALRLVDKDGDTIMSVRADRYADGYTYARIFSVGEKTDGTAFYNTLSLAVNRAGNRMVLVTDPAAWRAGIGAMGVKNANGYDGLAHADGTDTGYIRTTQTGLIPYQSGGSGTLGTSNWPFNTMYTKVMHIGDVTVGADPTTTSTVANIITAASGYTINNANVAVWGKVCTFHVTLTTTAAIATGNISNLTVGTIKEAYRPKISAAVSTTGTGPVAVGYIGTNGNLYISAMGGALAANGQLSLGGTYVLA